MKVYTSQDQAIGRLDRVGKVIRPGCFGPYSCLPCTGAVRGCNQLHSQIHESTDRLAETRTAPFLDLCALLEGERDSLSVALAVLFREHRAEYRNKCEGTHLGEGRCACYDTNLARFHAYTNTHHEEGACVCVRDFCFTFSRTMRSLTLAGIEAHIQLMILITHETTSG